jgi:hypothetical protein
LETVEGIMDRKEAVVLNIFLDLEQEAPVGAQLRMYSSYLEALDT